MKQFIKEYHKPKDWKTLSNFLLASNVSAETIMLSSKPKAIHDRNIESAIDLSGMHLEGIKVENGMIEIGVMTTLQAIVESDVLKSENVSVLCDAAKRTARINIRNLSVLGGILRDIDGPGELAAVLLILNAYAIIRNDEKTRKMPFSDYLDSSAKLDKGDVLIAVSFASDPNRAICLERVSRTPQDQEIVAAVVSIERYGNKVSDAKIAVSGATPSCHRFKSAEAVLLNQEFSESLAETAGETAALETNPKSDFRGSATYRKAMTTVLIKRAVMNAWKKSTASLGDQS